MAWDLIEDLTGDFAEVGAALQELTCFQALAQRESLSLPARKKAAEARLSAQLQREEELQQKFKQLTSDLADARRTLEYTMT